LQAKSALGDPIRYQESSREVGRAVIWITSMLSTGGGAGTLRRQEGTGSSGRGLSGRGVLDLHGRGGRRMHRAFRAFSEFVWPLKLCAGWLFLKEKAT
jgi:hypothetical protein